MNGHEWKPGDVAVRTSFCEEQRTIVVASCGRTGHAGGPHWHHAGGGWDPLEASGPTYRRLVVIDPEDREQVGRLLSIIRPGAMGGIDILAAHLREFADPKPPKPAEPTGLGAVVEDAEGTLWTRTHVDSGYAAWLSSERIGATPTRAGWSEVDAVSVLSEGVTA